MSNAAQIADRFQLEAEMDGPMKGPRKHGKRGPRQAGYASLPRSGPAGETCGSCCHLYRKHLSKTYPKCLLMRAHWTGGKGSDVKVKSPACRHWEKQSAAKTATAQ